MILIFWGSLFFITWCLMSWTSSLINSVQSFGCFRWETRSSSCYSILAGRKSNNDKFGTMHFKLFKLPVENKDNVIVFFWIFMFFFHSLIYLKVHGQRTFFYFINLDCWRKYETHYIILSFIFCSCFIWFLCFLLLWTFSKVFFTQKIFITYQAFQKYLLWYVMYTRKAW